MSDNNRFKDVINAARKQQQQSPPDSSTVSNTLDPPHPEPAKRGRPPGGKRNNPEYEQVGAYIPKALYKRVRIRLLEMEPEGEFSDLVEQLLTNWVQDTYRSRQE